MHTTERQQRSERVAEERRFLDALCFWRALYSARGPQDRIAVISVASVIAEASGQIGSAGSAAATAS